MDDEGFLRRPPVPRPYVPHDRILAVPESALRATLALLQQAGSRESGVFWYGLRHETGSGTVQAVIAPRQAMSRGNYHVSPAAMSEMVGSLHEHNWKRSRRSIATRAGVSSTPARRRDGHLCQHCSATNSAAYFPSDHPLKKLSGFARELADYLIFGNVSPCIA
jgi:hypothetical protein